MFLFLKSEGGGSPPSPADFRTNPASCCCFISGISVTVQLLCGAVINQRGASETFSPSTDVTQRLLQLLRGPSNIFSAVPNQ